MSVTMVIDDANGSRRSSERVAPGSVLPVGARVLARRSLREEVGPAPRVAGAPGSQPEPDSWPLHHLATTGVPA